MKIIDTFMFNNELDLLEFRLKYLYDHVDYFVLVESTVSHRGSPKPQYYALYNDRFEKYKDKIIHILTTDIPKKVEMSEVSKLTTSDNDHYKYREQLQRLKTMDGLRELQLSFEDIVLVSNIDEIPDPNTFNKLPELLNISPVVMKQQWLVWNYNMKREVTHQGTCAFSFSHLIQDKHEINKIRTINLEYYPSEYLSIQSGWHLNWFGSVDNFITKVYHTSNRSRDKVYYQRRKSFRDLSLNNRYPKPNPTEIEYLVETNLAELPHNIQESPFFNPNDEPMIYDSFIYNGEEETLRLRLYELYNSVDYFIIFEGLYEKDKFLFPDIEDKISEFEDKIIYVQVDDYSKLEGNVWDYNLSLIQETLSFLELKDEDFIYFSEIESIPSVSFMDTNYFDFRTYELDFITLRMTWFFENFYYQLKDDFYGTILTNWGNLKNSSLSEFYKMKDVPVHSVTTLRGWYLCNFNRIQYELYDVDVVLPTKSSTTYPKLHNLDLDIDFV